MKLSQFLDDLGQVVAYYPALAPVLGGLRATAFFCQLYYWSQYEKDEWIEKDADEIERSTGMTRTEQATAREMLKELGVIEAKLHGVPPTYAYQINRDRLNEAWENKEQIIAERATRNQSRTKKATAALAEKREREGKKPRAEKASNLRPTIISKDRATETQIIVGRKFELSSHDNSKDRATEIHINVGRNYMDKKDCIKSKEEKEKEGFGKPSENELLIPLLAAYRNIAKSQADETELKNQAEMMRGDQVSVAELTEWLKLASFPAIKFIASSLLRWRERNRVVRDRQKADAYVGASLPVEQGRTARPAHNGVYGQLLELLRQSVPPVQVESWFEPLIEKSVDDGVLYLVAPDKVFRQWIENNFTNELKAAVEAVGLRDLMIEVGQLQIVQEVAA
jgi:hypothetical protein